VLELAEILVRQRDSVAPSGLDEHGPSFQGPRASRLPLATFCRAFGARAMPLPSRAGYALPSRAGYALPSRAGYAAAFGAGRIPDQPHAPLV